jgi:hypothetical protein
MKRNAVNCIDKEATVEIASEEFDDCFFSDKDNGVGIQRASQ